jgi:putative tryptophan/tyrosine transport system substrate-binding protein
MSTRLRPTSLFLLRISALLSFLLVTATFVGEQHDARIAKIGQLISRSASRAEAGSGSDTIKRMLRELGYIDGKNITFEDRYADRNLDRLPILVEELVPLKVDVILTSSPSETLAAKKATATIPIVFYSAGDPVASGIVKTLARPGGNITGFTTIAAGLSGKHLELLKETVPKLSRVAVLWWHGSPRHWQENQMAARDLGLQLHSMELRSTEQLDTAFKEATKAGSNALVVAQSPLASFSNRKLITGLAAHYRLPAVYARSDFVESGGLMSYGADRTEPYRRIASMVDKILKGTKPADIPVEQPTKFELVINLKAAKQIGLTIPANVLARADRVIR